MTTQVSPDAQQPSTELDLDAVIRELDEGWDRLPEQALRQCQAHAELVTPRLIATIEEAVRLGREGKDRPGSAHVFALLLLTEFQATQALPVVLEAMALPDSVIDELYGDLITELFPRVLAVLAGDHPDLIESMVSSVELNEYVRWGAASSLCMLVRDKKLTRTEAIKRLARQLRAAIAAKDEWGTTITVSELGDLNPLEVQDEIKTAFEQELVDETMIDWAYFKDDLLHPDQPGEAPDLPRQRPSSISDTVEELRTWPCFTEKPVAPLLPRRGVDSISFDADNDDWDVHAPQPPGYAETIRHDVRRVGRNDPCPCGSGKKYKKCCLKSGDTSG